MKYRHRFFRKPAGGIRHPGPALFLYVNIAFIVLLAPNTLRAQTMSSPIRFHDKIAGIREILVLPVTFDCYHLTSGGIREYNNAMSVRGRELIAAAASEKLIKNGFSATSLSDHPFVHHNWRHMRHFYKVINHEILRNVYGPRHLPDAFRHFSYSLPPIPDSLLYPTTDAVLFISGFDDRATDKRNGRKTVAAAVSAVSVALIVLGGPAVIVSVPADQTFASCALVRRNGEIIWYYRYGKTGTIDMNLEHDVQQFIGSLLGTLKRKPAEP